MQTDEELGGWLYCGVKVEGFAHVLTRHTRLIVSAHYCVFSGTVSQCFSQVGYNEFIFILPQSLSLAKCSYIPSSVATLQLTSVCERKTLRLSQ
jgi:hypothetical protein